MLKILLIESCMLQHSDQASACHTAAAKGSKICIHKLAEPHSHSASYNSARLSFSEFASRTGNARSEIALHSLRVPFYRA